MNSLTRIMSYDKTKRNQENCKECVSVEIVKSENRIVEYPKLSEEEIEQIISERYFDKDEKTKTFIRKALRIHGNRYDYSNVIYIKSDVDVEIICRVEGHESFPQKPTRHLQGRGCQICGGTKKLTKEEFIKRANKIHNHKYDYSKVEYKDMKTDVVIICPIHGDFPQTPSDHLSGRGCKLCGIQKQANKRRMTLKEFIEQSRKIHGDKYDYSKVNYINNSTDVIITCPIHGDFPQMPLNHLRGEGCISCWEEKKATLYNLTLEEFIKRANEVHGIGRYDYSKVNYINMNTNVIITCPKHGDFPQTPLNHLQGCGCKKCKSSKGEIKVRNFLIENYINFEEQKRFNDCRYKNPLSFDFYLPQYNLCIEFDGEQHFIPHDFNSKETEEKKLENLKIVQLRDQIKNDYCKNNGINLLRIRYDEDIEKTLIKYFQNKIFFNL